MKRWPLASVNATTVTGKTNSRFHRFVHPKITRVYLKTVIVLVKSDDYSTIVYMQYKFGTRVKREYDLFTIYVNIKIIMYSINCKMIQKSCLLVVRIVDTLNKIDKFVTFREHSWQFLSLLPKKDDWKKSGRNRYIHGRHDISFFSK